MQMGNVIKKMVCLSVLICFFGTFVTPDLLAQTLYRGDLGAGEYGSESEGVGRALGGAAGMAGGFWAGTTIAGSILAAGGAGLAGLPGIIVSACVVCGLGIVGSKLGSHLGSWADRQLGPEMTWTLFGASIGAFAALMLLPALPWAGALAPLIKVLAGGVAGGLLARMFAPQLQAHATPRLIYAGLGGFTGGLAFGIPGALAGILGGYVLGGVFDRNFFSTPGRTLGEEFGLSGMFDSLGGVGNWIKNRALDVKDWVSNNTSGFSRRARDFFDTDGYYQAAYTQYPNDYYYEPAQTYNTYKDTSGGYKDYSGYGAEPAKTFDAYQLSYGELLDAMRNGTRDQQEQALKVYQQKYGAFQGVR